MDCAAPSPSAAPADARAAASPAAVSDARRAKIDKVAHDYESTFLSVMLGTMMPDLSAGMGGGAQGADAFKSFMTDAMAKSMVKHGGVGLARQLTSELLKLQGAA